MALKITDSLITTGSIEVSNDEIIERYTGSSRNPKVFLEKLGRNKRFHCSEVGENTITMGAKAAREILEKNNLTGDDIDLIAFCSQFPEYTIPTQSLIVHHHINAKEKCVTVDLNANCLGMLRGLDIVNRYFKDKDGDIKRALIIGADYMSIHSQSEELVTLGSFGDGACALLLEYTDDKNQGIIGSSDRSISHEVYGSFFPQCGISSIDKIDGEYTKLSWTNPETTVSVNAMRAALDDILEKHNMTTDDIDWFCGSQFAKPFFNEVGEKCNIKEDRRIYIGDRYGYTGTSSPFFSYTIGREEGKIKKGDVVLLTTVGIGMSVGSMLIRV